MDQHSRHSELPKDRRLTFSLADPQEQLTDFREFVEAVAARDTLPQVPRELSADDADFDGPEAVLAAVAKRFSEENQLAQDDVATCLRRLVAAEPRGQPVTRAELSRLFQFGRPGLLLDALLRMPTEQAMAFCKSEDPGAYRRRALIPRVLAGIYTPVLALDELGCVLSSFVEHQESSRESLVATGHPVTHFDQCPWLDLHLNKLYFTKLPTRAISPAAAGLSNDYADWRRIGERSTVLGWHDYPERENSAECTVGGTMRACELSWSQHTEDGWTECDYDSADTLIGLSADEANRLTDLRPVLFDLRCRVLCDLVVAIRRCEHEGLWERCLRYICQTVTAEDAEFLLGMDARCAGFEARTQPSKTRVIPLLAGGLTTLFELIGHVEKELEIGTMAKTRAALGDAVFFDHLQRPRLITERPYYEGRSSTRPHGYPYLDLVVAGKSEEIRAAVDIYSNHEGQEPAFRASFRRRAEAVIASEFQAVVAVRIKRQFVPMLAPRAQQTVDDWIRGLEGGEVLPPSTEQTDETDRNVFRWNGTDWELKFKTGPLHALAHLDGLFYLHALI